MADAEISNADQAEYWSSAHKWVDYEDRLDATLAPVLDRLLQEADVQPGQRVLDIGCGTGASTLQIADAVGADGHVTGADISTLLLARAKERGALADNVEFVLSDAQTYEFPPGSYDMALSRFGVMFFEDSPVAFANIGRAVKPGGRIMFMAWANKASNPWFDVPAQTAIDHFGPVPPADPRAPGPLAFADRDYVAGILESAGLRDISVCPFNIDLTPPGSITDAANLSCRVGLAARILRLHDGTESDALKIETRVAEAFEKFDTNDGVRLPAVLNFCQARVD